MSASDSNAVGITFSDLGTGIPVNEARDVYNRFAQYLNSPFEFVGSTKDKERYFISPDQILGEIVFEMMHFGFGASAVAIGMEAARGLASVVQASLEGRESRRIEIHYELAASIFLERPYANLDDLVALIRRSGP